MYFLARKNTAKTEIVSQLDDLDDAQAIAASYNESEAALDIHERLRYRYFVATLTEVEA